MKAAFTEAHLNLWFKNILLLGAFTMIFAYGKASIEMTRLREEYSQYKQETDDQLMTLSHGMDTVLDNKRKASFMRNEVVCLAKNIYFEARSESREGQLAVAQVTRNRVESGDYPRTYCGVVYQRKDTGCQFSWVCDGKADEVNNMSAYKRALTIAQDVLLKNVNSRIIGTDVMFYHANYVKPHWSDDMQEVTTIGQHTFYRHGN
jgi:spore germination cell wall hydrolase CwlJ-like protein